MGGGCWRDHANAISEGMSPVRCESLRVEGPGERTSDDPRAPSRARLVSVPDPLSRLRGAGTETRARARGAGGISELILTRELIM